MDLREAFLEFLRKDQLAEVLDWLWTCTGIPNIGIENEINNYILLHNFQYHHWVKSNLNRDKKVRVLSDLADRIHLVLRDKLTDEVFSKIQQWAGTDKIEGIIAKFMEESKWNWAEERINTLIIGNKNRLRPIVRDGKTFQTENGNTLCIYPEMEKIFGEYWGPFLHDITAKSDHIAFVGPEDKETGEIIDTVQKSLAGDSKTPNLHLVSTKKSTALVGITPANFTFHPTITEFIQSTLKTENINGRWKKWNMAISVLATIAIWLLISGYTSLKIEKAQYWMEKGDSLARRKELTNAAEAYEMARQSYETKEIGDAWERNQTQLDKYYQLYQKGKEYQQASDHRNQIKAWREAYDICRENDTLREYVKALNTRAEFCKKTYLLSESTVQLTLKLNKVNQYYVGSDEFCSFLKSCPIADYIQVIDKDTPADLTQSSSGGRNLRDNYPFNLSSLETISELDLLNPAVHRGPGIRKGCIVKGLPNTFAHFNPEMVEWAQKYLIPEPDRKTTGVYYWVLYNVWVKRHARLFAEGILTLTDPGQYNLNHEVAAYIEGMQNNFQNENGTIALLAANRPEMNQNPETQDPGAPRYLTNRYGEKLSYVTGFWLRRIIDGTADEFWNALDELMLLYDYDWYKEKTQGMDRDQMANTLKRIKMT